MAPQPVTKKKGLSWQRQQVMQRWVIRGAALVVAAIIAIVGIGYYTTQVQPRIKPVARVGGQVYAVGYLVDMVRYTRLDSQPSFVRGMLDRLVELLWDNSVLLRGSREFGVSASDDDIAKVLEDRGSAGSRAARDMARAELMATKIFETQFEPKAPKSAPQIRAQAMLLAGADRVQNAQSRLAAGEKFEVVAKELTELSELKEKGGEVDWVPRGVMSEVFEQVAFNLKAGELSGPVFDAGAVKMGGYWLLKVTDKQVDAYRVGRILLGSKEEALKVKGQLDGGADFAALAREVSQNLETKETGGDPGRLEGETQLPKAVLEAVKLSDLNVVSDPIYDASVSTKGAYWLVKLVEGPVEREVSARNREVFSRNLYARWFEEGRQSVSFENLLDDASKDWIARQFISRRPGSSPR